LAQGRDCEINAHTQTNHNHPETMNRIDYLRDTSNAPAFSYEYIAKIISLHYIPDAETRKKIKLPEEIECIEGWLYMDYDMDNQSEMEFLGIIAYTLWGINRLLYSGHFVQNENRFKEDHSLFFTIQRARLERMSDHGITPNIFKDSEYPSP
jgi:hypothetical protein